MKRTSERGIATATDFQNANGNMKNLVNEASVSISPSKQARPTLTITSQPQVSHTYFYQFSLCLKAHLFVSLLLLLLEDVQSTILIQLHFIHTYSPYIQLFHSIKLLFIWEYSFLRHMPAILDSLITQQFTSRFFTEPPVCVTFICNCIFNSFLKHRTDKIEQSIMPFGLVSAWNKRRRSKSQEHTDPCNGSLLCFSLMV